MAIIRKSLTKGTFLVDLPDDGLVKTKTCRRCIVKRQKFNFHNICICTASARFNLYSDGLYNWLYVKVISMHYIIFKSL
jgi:hypothetical protein